MLEVKGEGNTLVQVCGGDGIHVDTGASKYIFWWRFGSGNALVSIDEVNLR